MRETRHGSVTMMQEAHCYHKALRGAKANQNEDVSFGVRCAVRS